MKFKTITFPNGKQAFVTGNIRISLNGMVPKKITESEQDEETVRKFFNDPLRHKIDKNNKIQLIDIRPGNKKGA